MPNPRHVRVSVLGSALNGAAQPVEQFSWGFALGIAGSLTPAQFDSGAEQAYSGTNSVSAMVGAFFSTQRFHNYHRIDGVKYALIGTDGKYETEPFLDVFSQAGGNSSEARMPLQVATAVSLDTATRGAGGRGRFFLPGVAIPINSAFVYSPDNGGTGGNNIVSLAGDVADLLSNIGENAKRPAGVTLSPVCVVSRTRNLISPVTSVRVGHVPDTMRSRRRDLDEAYTQVPLA